MSGSDRRNPGDHPAPPVKSVSGSGGAVSCADCRKSARDTERIITLGLKVVRLRFGLHRSELPHLQPSELKIYLLSLLNPGKSIREFGRLRAFPRVFKGWDSDGLPKLGRLSRSDRWELAHSCNSLGRSLPPSCVKHTESKLDSWLDRATSTPPPPSSDYLKFARKVVRKVFSLGWDRSRYPRAVHSFSPQHSARAESGIGCGSFRADDFWSADRAPGHDKYISAKLPFSRYCLHGRWESPYRCESDGHNSDGSSNGLCIRCEYRERVEHFGICAQNDEPSLPHPGGFFLRVKDIPTVGKMRTIGIPSLNYDVLGPLHRAIYGHLTSQDWLMHGQVNAARVARVCTGKYQTSVDLVNATDGLNIEVTESILSVILSKSVAVPGEIRRLACQSLRPLLVRRSKGGLYEYHDHPVGRVSHGQMMGTYLSFPLLCLHSYIAGLWASRNSGLRGILVNGDDTIISHDLPLEAYPFGYEKNELKTLTSERTAELNSTVFVRRGGGWREIRSLRRFGADPDYKGILHMAGACERASPRWVSAYIRSKIGKRWGLSYTDLGLSPSHRLVWLRHFRMHGAESRVIPPPVPRDERYDLVTEPLSIADQVAFSIDLFDRGRSEPEVRVFNPSRTQVLKTCLPRRPVRKTSSGRLFNSHLSYEFLRDCPRPTSLDNRCRLEPDSFWAQSRREEREETTGWEEGGVVLSCKPPLVSGPLAVPLEGRLECLSRDSEWEQVSRVRCYDSGLKVSLTVTARSVFRDVIRRSVFSRGEAGVERGGNDLAPC
nr:MAG: RNA-dependent RNA polymerase [Botourmiaviridae sp.]